jgi:hypothetical protein
MINTETPAGAHRNSSLEFPSFICWRWRNSLLAHTDWRERQPNNYTVTMIAAA